jgi:DNA sulfur modification protein DndE
MFSHIRTSKENKLIVTELTRKFNLGSENHIARIALAYSLQKGEKLSLDNLTNSGGKEYSRNVLLGEFDQLYVGIICLTYGILNNNNDIPKYIKIHLDDGLSKLKQDFADTNELISVISSQLI